MRDISELSEQEAEFVNKLLVMYPEAFGYLPDKDSELRKFAAKLIEEGRVERVELPEDDGAPVIAYRLTDEHAEEVRSQAKVKREASRWN